MWQSLRPVASALALVLAATACLDYGLPRAFAFAEDVCPAEGGGWQNCAPVDREACPDDRDGDACQWKAIKSRVASQRGDNLGARSVVHMDATYLLAQAFGLSPQRAYVVAAYDQAIDATFYAHRDAHGALLGDTLSCDPRSFPRCLRSAPVHGFYRANLRAGGIFYHFPPPPARPPQTPIVQRPLSILDEPFLAHVQAWAETGTSLCAVGIDQAPDAPDRCLEQAAASAPQVLGVIPNLWGRYAIDRTYWQTPLGRQVMTWDAQGEPVYADQIARLTGEADAPLARLGIYLHVVQDRVTHYRCIDASHMLKHEPIARKWRNPIAVNLMSALGDLGTMPQPSFRDRWSLRVEADYSVHFHDQECTQPRHALRHVWETGYKQDDISEKNRTTRPALQATAAALRRVLGQEMDTDIDAGALIDALVAAAEQSRPQARIDAFTRVAERFGLRPLPGHGGFSLTPH